MTSLRDRDLERLTGAILKLAGQVEEMVRDAIRALCDGSVDLAREVIRRDETIDQLEVSIEEDCLRVLTLYDPLAGDLRRVMTVLKINIDLERMADLAVSIAQRALDLAACSEAVPIPRDLDAMAVLTTRMVRTSLDAFAGGDPHRARDIIALDDEVDQLHRRIIEDLKAQIRERPEWLDGSLQLFSAARHLERIADHATNIAEDVVYLAGGTIIRHRPA